MSVPLSILFVTGSLYDPNSGPFGILQGTACALHARQNNVTVIGTRDKWQTQVPPNWGVPTVALRKRGPASFHFAPGINRWLRSMRPSPTVVGIQSVWLYTSLAAARWARGRGIPYMVTLYGNLSPHALSVSRRKKQVVAALAVRHMLSAARCLHASSEAEYWQAREYGLRNPVCVVPNGVGPALPEGVPTGAPTPGPPENLRSKRILLYLGRLHPIKGLDFLLSAFAKVRSPEWGLVVAGPDDGCRAELESQRWELGLGDAVAFVGPQAGPEKSAWFHAAELFVLPSRSEGFAMAPLEAMGHGLPVLLTRACNFPQVEADGAGLVVGQSIGELAGGLQRLMTLPPSELRMMGERARAIVADQFSLESVAERLEAVFGWMAERGETPACVRLD